MLAGLFPVVESTHILVCTLSVKLLFGDRITYDQGLVFILESEGVKVVSREAQSQMSQLTTI